MFGKQHSTFKQTNRNKTWGNQTGSASHHSYTTSTQLASCSLSDHVCIVAKSPRRIYKKLTQKRKICVLQAKNWGWKASREEDWRQCNKSSSEEAYHFKYASLLDSLDYVPREMSVFSENMKQFATTPHLSPKDCVRERFHLALSLSQTVQS